MRGSRESFDSVRWRRDFRSRWHRRPTPQRSTSHPSSDSSSDRSWWKPTGWQSDFRRCPRLSNDKSCTRPGPIRRPDPIETSTTLWRQEPAQPEAHSRPLHRRYTHQAPPRLPHLSPSRTMHVPLADSLIHSTDGNPIYCLAKQEARTVPRIPILARENLCGHSALLPTSFVTTLTRRYSPGCVITGCPGHQQSPLLYSNRPSHTMLPRNSKDFKGN